MTSKVRLLAVVAASFTLLACQTQGEPNKLASKEAAVPSNEAHALAQAACGSCHSVELYGLSPVAAAPEWPVIANTTGLTRETLTTWLSDAHNYPEDMDFYLEEDETALLVDYILSLRRDGFEPSV